MKNYSSILQSIVTMPQLKYKSFTLDQTYDLSNKVVSKQSIYIDTLESFIYNICNQLQKQYFKKDISAFDKNLFSPDFFEKQDQYFHMHDMLQYFGSFQKFKLGFHTLYFYKKYNFTKFVCSVYAIQKCKEIPYILRQAITDFKIPKFPQIKNKTIKYSLFKQTKYQYLKKEITDIPEDVAIYCCNLPYQYYSKALHLRDQLCCYDINNNNFWFGKYNTLEKFMQLCNNIAKEGLKTPLTIKINDYGQLVNTSDCNVRALIALYLKLPYIPAMIYSTDETDPFQKDIPIINLQKQANQIFNPYLVFSNN